jgi:hypothetical protein
MLVLGAGGISDGTLAAVRGGADESGWAPPWSPPRRPTPAGYGVDLSVHPVEHCAAFDPSGPTSHTGFSPLSAVLSAESGVGGSDPHETA